ncbi:hypothetical protein [Sphingomonas sp. Leaf17]|uniref:hypothetical protein n=1 Tax=Sphingomonas sp. Leaf17 TaxID=1735683 RepID=UPI000AD64335|nr:hypothetical protein [Sphingomonas sp. Leaf17]
MRAGDPTMQIVGWLANRAAEAIVARATDRAVRRVKIRMIERARRARIVGRRGSR